MRNFTRILALVLLALMLVGMVPFAMFAEEAEGSTETTTPEIDTTKPYLEQLNDYLASVGGKLLYAQDFNGLDEYYTDAENGTMLPSQSGNGANMTVAPKDDEVFLKDGYALVLGTYNEKYDGKNKTEDAHNTSDPLFQVGMDQGKTKGANLVFEVSYKIHEKGVPNGTNLLMIREDFGSYRGASYLMIAQDGNYVTGISKKPLAPLDTDKFHDFKVVVNNNTNIAYYYVDGEYVCYDKASNVDFKQTKYGVYAPTMARCVMMQSINADEGLYVDNWYVYIADAAYGVENKAPTKGFLAETLMPYLSATGNRLMAGTDFENSRYDGAEKGDFVDGYQVYDKNYNHLTGNYTTATGGTLWRFYDNNADTGALAFNNKLTLATYNTANGNSYLSVDQQYPYAFDAYIDMEQSGYKAGTDFITTVAVMKYKDLNWANNLINYRWNDFGKGEPGTAADGSTATSDSLGTKWIEVVKFDNMGRIYAIDWSTGSAKNVYFAQMYVDTFTQISVAIHPSEGTADLYCDGYMIATITLNPALFPKTFTKGGVEYTFDDFGYGDFYFNTIRMQIQSPTKNATCSALGGISIDNAFFYTGSAPAEANGKEVLSGWVQDPVSKYWRYYKDGAALVGEQTVDGVKYFFEKNNAYVSEKQSTPIVDLYKTFNQQSGDTIVQGLSGNVRLAPSLTVKGSGKYTYLWSDMYNAAGGAVNAGVTLNPNVAYKGHYVLFNSNLKVTKDSISVAAQSRRLMVAGKTYYDLSNYYGLEMVHYTDIVGADSIKMQIVMHTDNVNSSTVGYTSNWDGSLGTAGGATKIANLNYTWTIKAANDGWTTTELYFYGNAKPSGTASFGVGRTGSIDRLTHMTIETNYSNYASNAKFAGYKESKIYFDAFNVFTFVPVTEIPGTGVVAKGDGLYYYDNAYAPQRGWIEADGNKYYGYPYLNGKLAVGNAVVDGVGMMFDDDGKLIDDTATGWFNVNGIECVYIDGVLQTGAFTYDKVNYYASSKGEIFSTVGEIGYDYDKAYTTFDFANSGMKFMMSQDFNTITAGSFVGNYSGGGSAGIAANSITYGSTFLNLVAKLGHFTIETVGDGDNALKVSQSAGRVDSYVNINFAHNKGTLNETTGIYEFTYTMPDGSALPATQDGKALDMVFEYDVMLGDDWAADVSAFLPINSDLETGARANNCNAVARINNQGYVYLESDRTKVLCKISNEFFTNLAFVVHTAERTCDVYVNGVLMIADVSFARANTSAKPVITEGRFLQFGNDNTGSAYIDNINAYLGDKPVRYDGTTAQKDGWVTEGGVQRYYQDGLMRTSALEIEGVYYYFDAKNGMCTGTAQGWIDNKFYENGVIVKDKWFETEDGLYRVDEEGNGYNGYYNIDGTYYYFNNGKVTKYGIDDSKVVLSVDQMINKDNGHGGADYSILKDGMNYSFKPNEINDLFSVNCLEAMDLSSYNLLAIDIWCGGDNYTGRYVVVMGSTETFYHLTRTANEDGTFTYTYHADGEAIYRDVAITAAGGWHETKETVTVGSKSYKLWQRNTENGIEYYGREWVYGSYYGNYDGLKAGWNTIYVPISHFGGQAKAVTQIGISSNGWGLMDTNKLLPGFLEQELAFGNVRVLTLADYTTEAKNGWVDGKYYDNSVLPATGWVEYDGNSYYFNEYGEMFTGYQQIDGVMYQFTETGALIGKANGKATYTDGYYVYNETYDRYNWVTYDAERIYVDGAYQTGKVTYTDGNSYFCDAENGAILKDTQVLFESYVYNCGADGVITPAARVWFTDTDGSVYYTTATGKVTANTSTKIDGFFYGFDATGKMIVDAYVKVGATGNNYRYCGPDGKCVTGIYDKVVYGYNEDGTPIYKTAYFNPTSGLKTVPTDGMIEGVEYVFDEEGYILYVAHDHAYDNDCDADCNVCGEVRATEHVYDNACDADCNVCGATREVAHDYDVVVIEPTCTTGGSTTYTCKGCGTSYVEDVTDATGHTEVIVPAVDATCTTDGYSEGTVCSVCATVIVEQIKIAAQGHVYDDDADATCNVCGEEREIVEPEVIIAQGACGASVNWKLLEDGTLVIYGNGGMEDCFEVKAQPYYNYLKQITKVVVKEGVTFIGRNAFYGYTAITEVVLPESLMAIEEYAFYGCSGLTEFDVPAKVFYIGKYAFRRSNITTFNFADQNGWAFVDGTVLDHSSARPLTKDATYMLACMKTVEGAGNVIVTGTFGSKDQFTWTLSDTGVLNVTGKGDMPKFNVNTTPWYGYRGAIRTVVIGEGVTSIGRCSFHTCRAIVSVTLPETIETIAQYGFYNMPYITEISIPASVTRIEGFALRKCVSLTSIEMGIYYGWTVGGTKLAAVELYNTTVDAFLKTYYNDVWERDVNAPFEDVNDPYFVAAGACNSYTNWKLVYVDEAKTQMKLTISGNGIMPTYGTGGAPWYEYAASIVEIEVTEGVTNVGRCAFYNLRYVTKVTLANTITSIDAYAFNGCKGLTEIVIPESVTNIDPTAFGKTGLTTIPTV